MPAATDTRARLRIPFFFTYPPTLRVESRPSPKLEGPLKVEGQIDPKTAETFSRTGKSK